MPILTLGKSGAEWLLFRPSQMLLLELPLWGQGSSPGSFGDFEVGRRWEEIEQNISLNPKSAELQVPGSRVRTDGRESLARWNMMLVDRKWLSQNAWCGNRQSSTEARMADPPSPRIHTRTHVTLL